MNATKFHELQGNPLFIECFALFSAKADSNGCLDARLDVTNHLRGNAGPLATEDIIRERVNLVADAYEFSKTLPVAEPFVDPMPKAPASLKSLRQWVRWKLENVNGRDTKVPYQVNGAKADSTDPNTWTDYESACKAGPINSTQGVGFVVDGGFVGIDLDGCRNPETGDIAEWAEQIIAVLDDSYTEVTPSQTGVRVWVRGVLPGNDKVFLLDPACGFGSKVRIEVYTDSRYFTVTGDSIFDEIVDVEERDLTQVYQLLHNIKAKYPAPKSANSAKSTAADAGESTPIEWLGTFRTSKFHIFATGRVESQSPFIVSDGIGRLRYESQSEADMAFATVAAVEFEGDADKIDDAMRASNMMRPKWERKDYREGTIAKAIASAERIKAQPQVSVYAVPASPASVAPVSTNTVAAAAAPVPTNPTSITAGLEEKDIPAYNPAIECGYFKDVVDAVCNGTTIPRQFMHNVIKMFVGTLVSGKLRFDGIDANACRYSVNIGASGTSKRTVWDRGITDIFGTLIAYRGQGNLVKIFDTPDSGAGLRDAFFESPKDAPIILMIDEAATLGNRSAETKNPEIIDTIIELADSTTISRVKAKKAQKTNSAKVHTDARLAMYICAQTGEVVRVAFAGRKKQGIDERLTIEFSPAIEPGDLPAIPVRVKMSIVDGLLKLLACNDGWKEPITATAEAKQFLADFWDSQPQDVRTKIRLRRNLWIEVYTRAFSRGEQVATLEDAQLCAEHFERDKVIRAVHFRGEISNKVGLYVQRLKDLTDTMRAQLNRGCGVGMVALSKRDLATKTLAYKDNELDVFERALNVFGKAHLWQVTVTGGNGQNYVKLIPMAYEDEVWPQMVGVSFGDFKG